MNKSSGLCMNNAFLLNFIKYYRGLAEYNFDVVQIDKYRKLLAIRSGVQLSKKAKQKRCFQKRFMKSKKFLGILLKIECISCIIEKKKNHVFLYFPVIPEQRR